MRMRGQSWAGIKAHVGYANASDAECAALARALESGLRGQTTPERVAIFTDAQAAIRWMASERLAPTSSTQSRRGRTSLPCGRPDPA